MRLKLFLTLLVSLLLNPNISQSKNSIKELYVMVPKGLNLRSEPNTKSKIIALIPYKQKIQFDPLIKVPAIIDDINGNWINATYKSNKGWVFSGYTCETEPLKSTSKGVKILKSLIDNYSSNKVKLQNSYYEYGLSPEEIIKRFGKPLSLLNYSGGGKFNYDKLWICFDDYFEGDNPTLENYKLKSYKHDYKTEGLYYFPKEKLSLADLFETDFKIGEVYYNGHDQKWESFIIIRDKIIHFQFNNLNDYIYQIRIYKNKK